MNVFSALKNNTSPANASRVPVPKQRTTLAAGVLLLKRKRRESNRRAAAGLEVWDYERERKPVLNSRFCLVVALQFGVQRLVMCLLADAYRIKKNEA